MVSACLVLVEEGNLKRNKKNKTITEKMREGRSGRDH